MNKKKMIDALSERTHFSQHDCLQVLNAFMDLLGEEIERGEKVMFLGFGTFYGWKQTERPGRNPRTGENVVIRSRTSVKFKPGSYLLDRLNTK